MNYLLHGDNPDKSRRELIQLTEKIGAAEIIRLHGDTVTATDIFQACESSTLLTGTRLIIIENFFTALKKAHRPNQPDINIWKNLHTGHHLILWESKPVPKTILNQLPKEWDVAVFEIDRQIFRFLDAIRPGNHAEMIILFSACLLHEPAELIMSMLARQVRLLLMVKDLGKQTPGLSSWQISRLQKQAGLFTVPALLKMHSNLLAIEENLKTGKLPGDISQELKMFLVNI